MSMIDTPLYTSVPVALIDISQDVVLCAVLKTSRTYLIERSVARCLQYAQAPSSRIELIQRLIHATGVRPHIANEWFEKALKDRLLIAIDHRTSSIVCDTTIAINDVCCVSAMRPDALTAMYKSCLRYSNLYGRQLTLSITDDSISMRDRAEYRARIQSWPRATGVSIQYSDRVRRSAFCDLLVKQGITPEVVHYGLLGLQFPGLITTGSAKNVALLESKGRRILLLDDDVLFETNRTGRIPPQLAICSDLHFRRPEFFASREELNRHFPPTLEVDILKEHEYYLGRSVSDIAMVSRSVYYPSPLSPRMREVLTQQTMQKILLSHSGVIGASGMFTGTFWLINEGMWSQQLRNDPHTLELALSNRYIRSAAVCPTITDNPFCQSMALGLANDHELPCFLPSGRNQDGVFGLLLQSIYPACMIHIPFAQCHVGCLRLPKNESPQSRVAEMILSLIATCLSIKSSSAGTTLRDLGQAMEMVATGTSLDFEWLLTKFRNQRVAGMLARISTMLDTKEHNSEVWEQTLRKLQDDMRRSIESKEDIIPIELRSLDYEIAIKQAQEIALQTSRLFQQWIDIENTSRILQQAGRSLSEPV